VSRSFLFPRSLPFWIFFCVLRLLVYRPHSLLKNNVYAGVSLQLLGQLGDGNKEIGDQAVVGDLEDGCLGVLVDGNNGLGVLHTGQMLDSA
jgi:hypothetical protein